MFAQTFKTPYYAVIFTSIRKEEENGYIEMLHYLEEMVKSIPGYLGIESARQEIGVSVSYWSSLDAIKIWKDSLVHAAAQKMGKERWYTHYKVRICLVERDYEF
jgi:heme-degrading monooxygenase HmoA